MILCCYFAVLEEKTFTYYRLWKRRKENSQLCALFKIWFRCCCRFNLEWKYHINIWEKIQQFYNNIKRDNTYNIFSFFMVIRVIFLLYRHVFHVTYLLNFQIIENKYMIRSDKFQNLVLLQIIIFRALFFITNLISIILLSIVIVDNFF